VFFFFWHEKCFDISFRQIKLKQNAREMINSKIYFLKKKAAGFFAGGGSCGIHERKIACGGSWIDDDQQKRNV
jgi:hypothetical protein